MEIQALFESFIHQLQNEICTTLEKEDDSASFVEDLWQRPEGGGGKSRILSKGKVIEKAGVNTSVVYGPLPDILKKDVPENAASFYASGISLVIHPVNPFVPACHANFRYFAVYDDNEIKVDEWFGGGADLTPYYLMEEDVVHFHTQFKNACDKTDSGFYPKFKSLCDSYFYNSHRGETRGVGGIFYDHLRPGDSNDITDLLHFATNAGNAFIPAYIPLVSRHKNKAYSDSHRKWQEIRRGRYVEFNLLHDRGTLFGLKTGGRTESILMSLPPVVRWEYNHNPPENSPEQILVDVLKNPRNWIKS